MTTNTKTNYKAPIIDAAIRHEKASPRFHEMVGALLGLLGVDNNAAMQKPEVYTVTLEKRLQVQIFGAPPDCLNMMCFAGKLSKNVGKEALLALLQGNLFTYNYPPIAISVDAASSQVVLWSRLLLNEATAEAVSTLFFRFAETSDAVCAWLEQGAPAVPVIPASGQRKQRSAESFLKQYMQEKKT